MNVIIIIFLPCTFIVTFLSRLLTMLESFHKKTKKLISFQTYWLSLLYSVSHKPSGWMICSNMMLFLKYLPESLKVAQSCPTLCDPMVYTVYGILQARILEWVAFPFSRGSSSRWVRWHHQLEGHEFEQTLGDSEGQGSLVCCSPWSGKELDMT